MVNLHEQRLPKGTLFKVQRDIPTCFSGNEKENSTSSISTHEATSPGGSTISTSATVATPVSNITTSESLLPSSCDACLQSWYLHTSHWPTSHVHMWKKQGSELLVDEQKSMYFVWFSPAWLTSTRYYVVLRSSLKGTYLSQGNIELSTPQRVNWEKRKQDVVLGEDIYCDNYPGNQHWLLTTIMKKLRGNRTHSS
jgi:hypothetical protein